MTSEQRYLFLSELRVSGNLSFASAAAGVTRAEAYRLRILDDGFHRSWMICQQDARQLAAARAAKNRADLGVHSTP